MTDTPALEIGLVRGDGIGPELVDAAVTVLDAAVGDRVRLSLHEEDGGAGTYARTGTALSDEALHRIAHDYDATLKGPVGLPDVRKPDGTEAGLLGGILRGGLDAYANIRPVTGIPGAATTVRPEIAERIDYVIVRENTEGLYLSRDRGVRTPHAASDQLLVTRVGTERIARAAFELARTRDGAPADGVRRVTCVDKSNVLGSFALFREVAREVAAEFPDVELDFRYSDAAGHDLVADPWHFDVVVLENFLGDLLSDVGAATVGGLGMCGAGNIGAGAAYFEPVHGSAPSIAGTDRANPVSQILSAAMLLDHVGLHPEGARVRAAVRSAFGSGALSLDERGCPAGGTAAAAATVVAHLAPA